MRAKDAAQGQSICLAGGRRGGGGEEALMNLAISL